MAIPRDRDPLAPIEFVVKVLLAFLLVLLGLFAGAAAWQLATTGDTNVGLGAFSDGELCVRDVHDVPTYGTDGSPPEGIVGFDREGGRYYRSGWEICAEDATTAQRVAQASATAVDLAGVIGSMALLLWAVRGARRSGFFTSTAARRTRFLGWYFLASAVVAPVVTAAGNGIVVASLVEDYDWWRPLSSIGFTEDLSILAIVVGIGIITFARILERAVPLQEEVDATV